jgi:hypothetical protein
LQVTEWQEDGMITISLPAEDLVALNAQAMAN